MGDKAKPSVTHHPAALLFERYGSRNNSGSLAIFAAIRRASSHGFARLMFGFFHLCG
jgi:hypothetical protein